MIARTLALTFPLAAIALTAAEASITITQNGMRASTADLNGPGATASFTGTTIPTNAVFNADDGPRFSHNTVSWSQSGGLTTLSLDIAHQRDGSIDSPRVETENFNSPAKSLRFTADTNAPYTLSGFYSVTDGPIGPGEATWLVSFVDLTLNAGEFFTLKTSSFTPNVNWFLGDGLGFESGSLSGQLIASHLYELSFYNSIAAKYDDGGASAVGNLTLKIGENGAVPEPLSILVWGALTGVVAAKARARTA